MTENVARGGEHLEAAIEHLESAQSAARSGEIPIGDINQSLAHLRTLQSAEKWEALP